MPDNQPLPHMAMTLQPDAMSGFDLHLQLQNFRLGPPIEEASSDELSRHAHLYINGEKKMRL